MSWPRRPEYHRSVTFMRVAPVCWCSWFGGPRGRRPPAAVSSRVWSFGGPRGRRPPAAVSSRVWSFVDELLGSGEEPGQAVAEAVAPVLPVVAVARLRVAHRHDGLAEDRDHRPVRADE